MEIQDCGLPLRLQKLYIRRLKHMIERWEFEKFCTHCPANVRYDEGVGPIRDFWVTRSRLSSPICQFCMSNTETIRDCPCHTHGRDEALKRAKDFIARFEAIHGVM